MKTFKFLKAAFIFCIAIIIFCGIFYSFVDETKPKESNNCIRLHIIANSDSEHDQSMKLFIRDEIFRVYGSEFENISTQAECEEIILSLYKDIEDLANNILDEYDEEFCARAEYSEEYFPTRTYAGSVYPAGTYKALKLYLGKGEGANWWCVMFPPLCVAEIREKDDCESYMDNEEYRSKYEIKFKFKEIYCDAKNWIVQTKFGQACRRLFRR